MTETADNETLSVSAAREQFAQVIDRVYTDHLPVYVTRHGHRVAAIINADELDRLLELAEDMEDILAAEEARAEMEKTGEAPIPWETVKAELGL